jgi:hypothetical protein
MCNEWRAGAKTVWRCPDCRAYGMCIDKIQGRREVLPEF